MNNTNINLNDNSIRLVFIPAFGLIIPNAAGLINNNSYSLSELCFAYFFFIFISFLIWQGNRFLLFRLRKSFSWLDTPVKKIILLLLSNVFYTVPITVGLLLSWYSFSKAEFVDWDSIFTATLMCVICVIFITHVYETVFLIRQLETDAINREKLEKAKTQAELDALKNQIDPHFIFNSLNTLSYLIENDTEKAKSFNENLADVYRYILLNRDRDLVLLKDEIDFLISYYSLIQIRFDAGVSMNININQEQMESFLIPPISLQVLLENAIKHNDFSEERPLIVTIRLLNEAISVTNEIRLKSGVKESSNTGLNNLQERYKLTTGKEIKINNHNSSIFNIELPVLKV